MSKTTSVFQTVPVKVQDRSGFDMSHENLFTATVGTLIPFSVEEVLPGDIASVGAACSVELPPLVTNFKGRVDARMEFFFVPNRLLWAGWKDFICADRNHLNLTSSGTSLTYPTNVPQIYLQGSEVVAGTLADYLGVKGLKSSANDLPCNALPFLAYQKVVDDWYRDSNIQKPFFVDGIQSTGGFYAASMPFMHSTGNLSVGSGAYTVSNSKIGFNGRKLSELAQRNFAKDYFTTMTTTPAAQDTMLQFDVEVTQESAGSDTSVGVAGFSIRSLRAANALAKWLEKNQIAGTRYYDQILAHYGVLPSDAVFQRAVLLGSETIPVIVNSLGQDYQPGLAVTGSTTGYTASGGSYYVSSRNFQKNPYLQSIGGQAGHGTAFGKGRLVDNFEVKEHGFIIGIFSLVPHAYYSQGTRRYLSRQARYRSGDYAFPEFAGIGDQPIYKSELYSAAGVDGAVDETTIVGYAQRFCEYKFHEDEVHGLLRDGENLSSFVLQRGFDSGVTLSSDLLEIPKTYMDDVMVTTTRLSGFNAIVDAYVDARYLRVLPQYSMPSLCESEGEGGKKVNVPKNGTRL